MVVVALLPSMGIGIVLSKVYVCFYLSNKYVRTYVYLTFGGDNMTRCINLYHIIITLKQQHKLCVHKT